MRSMQETLAIIVSLMSGANTIVHRRLAAQVAHAEPKHKAESRKHAMLCKTCMHNYFLEQEKYFLIKIYHCR